MAEFINREDVLKCLEYNTIQKPSANDVVSATLRVARETVMGKEQFYRTMYRMKKITAVGVWEKVDEGELTKAQALRICGPRPKES